MPIVLEASEAVGSIANATQSNKQDGCSHPHGSGKSQEELFRLRKLKDPLHLLKRPPLHRSLTDETRVPRPRLAHDMGSVSLLYPGSTFTGDQRSGKQNYSVRVSIHHVDMSNSTLCGYLYISGLTAEHPELTTYFSAEIVGEKYSFFTHKWGASPEVDREHWSKFPAYHRVAPRIPGRDFRYDPLRENTVFMRWKEEFLVHPRVSQIEGASFEGFYYTALDRSSGRIKGLYWHQSSEKFQELNLAHSSHVDATTRGSYEFR